ncbi:MAG TPA: 16S rRNA (adenine(1518)-N(6)/adenine(1519)-N(6))-dimethyltransferase RsmA [Smithella sp.]|nr:16S rRNA (adenine(1518)-N(6)/adenine(1519)-N(6))-dimethyltransferase RsmA [Smithella sp.]
MSTPRQIITQYAIKPRKSLGQSFLMDENVIGNIAAAAHVTENDIVVEIGAGIGVLTQILARNAAKVIAVELDDQLAYVLKDRLSAYHNIQIYHGNILRFDFREIARAEGQKIKIVGNIPYNISSPVLFYLLSFRDVIDSFVLMMQKEVIARLVASPGGKSYGVPSVILQMFSAVEKILDVGASCFYPRPKVESSVMKGFFRESSFTELADEDFFIKLVRDAFAKRRKMLINNLKQSKMLYSMPESSLKEALISAGIDSRRRAETLSVEEFGNLSNILRAGLK